MSLKKFCKALGLGTNGSSKKITALPADLLELYRGITNDDDRRAQRGKIKNIQLPAIRRKHPQMTLLYTTQGRPRARTRTRKLPRHTMEVHLLGHHGIEPRLGQKPKLGGRYTDITLIYIYHVWSVLCISI